jgi:hypothetical protein
MESPDYAQKIFAERCRRLRPYGYPCHQCSPGQRPSRQLRLWKQHRSRIRRIADRSKQSRRDLWSELFRRLRRSPTGLTNAGTLGYGLSTGAGPAATPTGPTNPVLPQFPPTAGVATPLPVASSTRAIGIPSVTATPGVVSSLPGMPGSGSSGLGIAPAPPSAVAPSAGVGPSVGVAPSAGMAASAGMAPSAGIGASAP